jgi:hypothetical protein
VALKDNLSTRGVPTTCASRILKGYLPPYDAHVVTRLREAGAVIAEPARRNRVTSPRPRPGPTSRGVGAGFAASV